MKRLSLFIIFIAVIVAVVVVSIRSQIPQVEVAYAAEGSALDAVSGNVEVLPVLETTVKSERNGFVKSVITLPADEVLSVEMGDTLAQLDTELVDSEIALSRLKLDAATARLKAPTEYGVQKERLAEELERLSGLLAAGRVSEAEVVRARAELERLEVLDTGERVRREQQVALLKNQLEQRELWKRQHTVVAPTKGKLNAVYVFPGDIVNLGSQVAKIHTHELLVKASVREEDFMGIAMGNPVRVRFLAFSDQEFSGEVSGLSPTANIDSRQRDVFVNVCNPPKGLVSGMTGQAVVVKAEREGTITVPRRALMGNYLCVVQAGKVELRKVRTGFVGLDVAEILDGVSIGEAVIVDRPHVYRDGETVKIESAR